MMAQWLGFAGVALGLIAFLPQIFHLLKERCSAGISLRAYLLWSLAAAALFAHAWLIRDAVFIAAQGVNFLATALVTLSAKRLAGQVCEFHSHPPKSLVS